MGGVDRGSVMVAVDWWERRTLPVIAANVSLRTGKHGATSISNPVVRGVELLLDISVVSPAPGRAATPCSGVSLLLGVASVRHVDMAFDAGIDCLMVRTGAAHPSALVRAVLDRHPGTVAPAGRIGDGSPTRRHLNRLGERADGRAELGLRARTATAA